MINISSTLNINLITDFQVGLSLLAGYQPEATAGEVSQNPFQDPLVGVSDKKPYSQLFAGGNDN